MDTRSHHRGGVRLSVIIPTLNEADHVARAIASAWSCGAMEVIVADGASCDDTTIIAERQAARVVRAPRGRALQQNAGAREAHGDLLLFLHADNRLDEACGPQIARAAAGRDFVAAAFRQRIDAQGWMYRLLEWGNAARARHLEQPYGDQGLLIRRDAFERLGGFPEVALMEDVLLVRKVRKIGKVLLLRGPLHVSGRRWQRHGVIRQTLRNWTLLAALSLGASPDALARFYRPHGGGVRE
jgi:rSAM/selenodomain-associated transferase 2